MSKSGVVTHKFLHYGACGVHMELVT